MSKIDLEIADDLEFEDGDCAVIIKNDGSIGRVVMPTMNKDMLKTEGYRKLLDVLEVLKPGTRDKFIKHNQKAKGSIH
tara:strand:+ start:2340 stop:2573 length:234 start_codon:yes stop_codon:yes gene_type:complete